MVYGLGVDITPLIGEAVARGGHIRVGLKDALLGSHQSIFGWSIMPCGRRARGGEPAVAAEVQQTLAEEAAISSAVLIVQDNHSVSDIYSRCPDSI